MTVPLLWALTGGLLAARNPLLEDQSLRLEVEASTASARLVDKRTGEAWELGTPRLVAKDGSALPPRLSGAVVTRNGVLSYRTQEGIEFRLRLAGEPRGVEYSFDRLAGEVAGVRLLDNALAIEPGAGGYYAVPNRLGILIYPEGGKSYTRRLTAYAGTGYSTAMFGVVKNGSALLSTWEDVDTVMAVDYAAGARRLAVSLELRREGRSVRLQPLGPARRVFSIRSLTAAPPDSTATTRRNRLASGKAWWRRWWRRRSKGPKASWRSISTRAWACSPEHLPAHLFRC